jgi:hypothetical protein
VTASARARVELGRLREQGNLSTVLRSSLVLCWVACVLPVAACQKKPPAKAGPVQAVSSVANASRPSPAVSSAPNTAPGATTVLRTGTHELADCSNTELRACLGPFIKPRLSANDIRALASADCFKRADVVRQAADCLPLQAGTDIQRRKELVFVYSCSDVCPDQGGVWLAYANVSAEECCKLEGQPFPAWGGYGGCSPPEAVSEGGELISTPDGKYYRVVWSGCPVRRPIIFEEWSCEPPIAGRRALGLKKGPLPPRARYAPNAKRYPDTDCPKGFDPALAERAAQALDGEAIECLTSLMSGIATIQLSFAPTGQAARARLAYPPSLNNTQGRCIEKVYQRAKTQPFKGESAEVLHNLRLHVD